VGIAQCRRWRRSCVGSDALSAPATPDGLVSMIGTTITAPMPRRGSGQLRERLRRRIGVAATTTTSDVTNTIFTLC
jgi:hypothetical protein